MLYFTLTNLIPSGADMFDSFRKYPQAFSVTSSVYFVYLVGRLTPVTRFLLDVQVPRLTDGLAGEGRWRVRLEI